MAIDKQTLDQVARDINAITRNNEVLFQPIKRREMYTFCVF